MRRAYDNLVEKATGCLLRENAVCEEEADVYRFGIEVTILKALHLFSYLVIAVCMRRVPEFIVIFSIFCAFRRNVGGFHAKTRTGCYLFSCSVIVMALAAAGNEIDPIFLYGLTFCELMLLLFVFPVKNENRPLDEEEIVCFRKRLFILILLYMAAFVLTAWARWFRLIQLYVIGLTLAASLALLGKIQERRNQNGKA